MKFGAVIAAAGLSSRMRAFKPLLPLGNTTFIERIITTLQEGGVEKIVVVTGRDAPLITEALAGYNCISFIYNKDFAITDMFYSASLGLKFMAELADGIFFSPVDTPLFSADTVRALAAALQNDNMHIMIPMFGDTAGHPVLMRAFAAKELILSSSPGGLKGAIDAYSGPKGALKTDDSGIVYDADTPEDYQLFRAG